MSLARLSHQRRTVVLSLVFITFVFGLYQFFTMPRRADPAFTIRSCQIMTTWPGIEAERVERLITAPIEETMVELEDVKRVTSTTTTGRSVIMVEARDEIAPTAIPQLWDKVRARVDRLQSSLPDAARAPVVNDDFGQTSILQLALSQPFDEGNPNQHRYSPRDLRRMAHQLRDRLSLEDGVSSVQLHGVPEERIVIETDMDDWALSSVTIDEIEQALSAHNTSRASGSLETDTMRLAVNASGEYTSVEAIRQTPIRIGPGEVPITLEDLGLRVSRQTADPPQEIVRVGSADQSAPAIILSVTMVDGTRVTELGPRVLRTVDAMQSVERLIPSDIAVDIVYDEAGFVDRKVSDFVINVLESIAIVVVIALLLAGLRSALVMAAAIPFVMVISIGLSTFFGIQLEQMSIASLIIALGLLVDNAVVVTDNTRRFLDEGHDGTEASIRGVQQLMLPILVGTLTTVFAFIPLAIILTGAGKEYVYSIPVVVSTTLLVSWVIAITLTMLLAATIVRRSSGSTSPLAWLMERCRAMLPGRLKILTEFDRMYAGVLRGALRLRLLVVLILIAVFAGVAFLPIGTAFFPEDIRRYSYINVWLPEGSSLEATNRAAQEVEALVREAALREDGTSRLRRLYTSVGGSGPRFALGVNPTPPSSNFAQIVVEAEAPQDTEILVTTVRNESRERIAGARVIHNRLSLGPGLDAPIGIRVSSPGVIDPGFADIQQLRETAAEIESILRRVRGTWDVHNTWGAIARQAEIDIQDDDAISAGTNNAAITRSVNAFLNGSQLTTMRDGDEVLPVLFRLPGSLRSTMIDPRTFYVEGVRGKVPLDAVATVGLRPVPTRIERRDRQRVIEVRANVEDGFLANEAVNAARPEIDALRDRLPSDISIEYGGTLEQSGDAQVEMMTALGLGVILIILTLIIQYNSVTKPFLVLATVPMGFVGALIALSLSGSPMGFMPLLGMVALAGMVVNSGILYLEFADELIVKKLLRDGRRRYGGMTKQEFHQCLVEAGRLRLLPIVLTASTTIGGLIPLALFGGPMWEGMAWLLIGGLIAATVLTLVVLPVFYSLMASLGFGLPRGIEAV